MPKTPSNSVAQFYSEVKPLASNNRKLSDKPKVSVNTKSKQPVEMDSKALPLSDCQEGSKELDLVLSFYRPNTLKRDWQKLKKGQLSVERQIDLHGLYVEEARTSVSRFLQNAFQQNLRCVRIIHGKGKHSLTGGVLKQQVNHWLPQIDFVLGFHSCEPRDGGNGAVYVLLKKRSS